MFPQIKFISIWVLIIFGYLSTIYDTYYWIYGETYNRFISALLFPSTRVIWTLSTATLVWMCISGNGGLVNRLLSSKVLIPLSRATYSIYLTHMWIVWTFWGSKRELVDVGNYQLVLLFLGVITMTFITSVIFSLLFETPLREFQTQLMKYFLSSKVESYKNSFEHEKNH
jgi:peptidoglycan/LPS O-acetylase OafA/YrhL